MAQTTEHQAVVNGRNLSISTKHAIEIAKFIKGRSVQQSKTLLEQVIKQKVAVPFTSFKRDMGHKPGPMAAGRYPEKASKEFIMLLDSLEANAVNKGLDTNALRITTIIPNKASRPWHPGRQRRRKMKRTHVTILAEEVVNETSKRREQKKPTSGAEQKKTEQKGAEKK